MKTYNSMYLGMCISNNDPEMRGRVQIFIPHIMPTVYKYADESTDIEFSAVGDNIAGGLRTEIVEKLKAVLPWAESASPIVCSSTPGALIPGTNQAVATPTAYPNVIATGSDGFVIEKQQGKIRNLPISEALKNTIIRGLKGTGLNFVVTSGGQPTAEEGGPRVGSTRHDRGNAADGIFYDSATGEPLNPSSSDEDRNRIKIALYQLDQAGIQGMGWGRGYMGPLTFHLDVQTRGTWGAGGASANAEPWVVAARQGQNLPQISSTTTPSVSSAESTAPAQPPIPAAQATKSEPLSAALSPNSVKTIRRSAFKDQLTPEALRILFILTEAEVGSQGNAAKQAFIETVFNRAYIQNDTLIKTITNKVYYKSLVDGNYDEKSKLPDTTLNKNTTFLEDVLNGSNITNGATHNASAGVAGNAKKRIDDQVGEGKGANYVDYGGELFYNKSFELRRIAKLMQGLLPYQPIAPANSITTTSTTNPYGPVNYIDTNDRPRGTFAIPAPGAMLWVFFREGNPQFPVFFATSFSQKEWAASGVYNSGGAQTYTNSGAGQMISTDILTPEGVTHSAFTVGGGDTGSNLSFAPDHTSLYSAMSFRQDTMHDSFHVIGGNHEQKVYGESSHTVFGDRIRRVGTFTDEAYEAANQLWAQVKETNDTLAQPS